MKSLQRRRVVNSFLIPFLLIFAFQSRHTVAKRSPLFKHYNDGVSVRRLLSSDSTAQEESAELRKPEGVRTLESSLTMITHSSLPRGMAFCRVHGVCRVGDGTFLLPVWMKTHSAQILACGLQNVSFSIEETRAATAEGSLRLRGTKSMTLMDDYRDFDVVGIDAPRGERHLLADDILPSILMLDMFKRLRAYENFTRVACLTKDGNTSCEMGKKPMSALSPMILIDSRISETKDFLWPKSLLRLIRNSVHGDLSVTDLKDIYGWQVRSKASCFRSVISTNLRTADVPSDGFLPDNIFFAANGLTRQAAERPEFAVATCNVKVLILNRYGKRFIEGSAPLASLISSYGRNVSKLDESVIIEPEVVFFENSSFHEQVAVMQEANVVVATHGDSNSNLMFLRPKARVFEIMPFGFSSDLFRNLTKAYGGIYEAVHAQADVEVFAACVRHFNPGEGAEREAFIQEWEDAAKKYRDETIRREANIESNYLAPDDESTPLKSLRHCASYQRISVDLRDLARKVVLGGARQCHVRGDLSFLMS